MMNARHDGALAVRFTIPWWVSFTAAAAAYLFCSFLVPSLMSGNPALSRLTDWLIEGAPFLGIAFTGVGALAFFRELGLRRLRQTQSQLESIRGMDWQNFELYRTLTSEQADGALLVTSGTFTPEAEAFARDKPIGLVGGLALLELVETVQNDSLPAKRTGEAPRCPVCERPMSRNKAGRDSTIGEIYWTCLDHPRCPGTRQI